MLVRFVFATFLLAAFAVTDASAQDASHFRYLDDAGEVAVMSATPLTSAARPQAIASATAPGASGFVSDDFSAPSLDAVWTFVNPASDAFVSVNGTQAVIDVPATGVIHDAWTNENTLPRLMQDVTNGDFEIVAKFESPLSADGAFRSQGILIEQTELDVLRFEFHRYGGKTKIFAVALFGGGYNIVLNKNVTLDAPMFLRVTRVGNQWSVAFSGDGVSYQQMASFSQSMTVARAGVFAGNGAANSHTALIDYVFESSAPVVPEDGSGDAVPPTISNVVVNATAASATITWETDEPATSRVDYGEDAGYGSFEASATLVTNHSIVLNSLSPSTTYHFSITSEDALANSASTSDDTFLTEAVDAAPPVISNVQVVPTGTGATVTWDTDEPATSRVDYGEDAGYGSFEADPTLVTSHVIVLTSLDPGTTYHYAITSEDALANSASTSDDTFSTASGDVTPPVISNVVVVATTTGATVSWDTDEPASSRVDFGPDAGYGSFEAGGALVTNHQVELTGLVPGMTYHFAASSADADGNAASTGDDTFATDPVPFTGDVFDFSLEVVDGAYPGNGRPGWSASGDINQDGLVDAVSGGGNAIQWYEAPSWTRHSIETPTSTGGNGGIVQDVDGDGDLDIVSALYNDDLVWWENPGPATVTQPWSRHTIDGSSLGFNHDLIAADLDGDGQKEIIALFVGSGGVRWYDIPANPATDPWPMTTILNSTSDPFVGLASGDLDQDGDIDVVVSNKWYENENPNNSNWQERVIFSQPVQNLFVFDVDQDGRNDLVGAQGFETVGLVMWGRGPVDKNDPWVVNYVDAQLDGPENVWAGDLQNDGLTDIVTGEMETSDGYNDSGSNIIAYSATDASGTQWVGEMLAENVGVSARLMPVDIDQDGDYDFTADGNAENHIYLWRNNDAPEVVISNVQVVAGSVSATVTWNTNKPATSRVDYGADAGYGSFEESAALVTSHSVELTSLNHGSTYHFSVTSDDLAGSVVSTADDTFETEELDTTPPVVSNVLVVTTESGATITWDTDEPATSRVDYGADAGYGSFEESAALVTNHTIVIGSLTPASTYHFSITSVDESANSGSTADDTFTTDAPDLTPPVISNLQVATGPTGATITWSTDEPATSRVDYGADAGYGQFLESATLVTNHSVVIGGLAPDTEYHFSVTSEDGGANSASTPDDTFTTDSASGVLISDDFSGPALNPFWTFVNPLSDATAFVNGSQAVIDIPASGTIHDVWTNENTLPRIVQDVADTDFEMEAKFESAFSSTNFQSQGILIEQSDADVIRIEFHRYSNRTKIFVATIFGGSATVRLDDRLTADPPMFLRVTRVGSQFTIAYSFDGSSYTTGATFNQSMTVNRVGVYAGNAANTAHAAVIDYVFDTSAPIVPEDGGVSDSDPPVISNVQVSALATSATITWDTNEPATSRVDYGLDAGYGSFEEEAPLVLNHSVTLTDLAPETDFHFQITAVDAAENEATTTDATFTTGSASDPPIVDVWYGDTQSFGDPGEHQTWVNILGNVWDGEGVASLSFTLNGGASQPLSMGPDQRRLVDEGDFNIEIDYGDLLPGANAVTITAVDVLGNIAVENVTVDFSGGNTWPLPYTADWSAAGGDPQVPARMVDGLWEIGANGLRTMQFGYDRTFGIGDVDWDDYEVTIPVTVHSIDPTAYTNPYSGNGAHLGIILRWPGHVDWDGSQPRHGWHPYGGVGGYVWKQKAKKNKFSLGANTVTVQEDLTGVKMELDIPYIIKMRVETLPGDIPHYSFKVWEAAGVEPGTWLLSGSGQASDPQNGGMLLVAHHIDVTVGDINVVPLPPAKQAMVVASLRGDANADGRIADDDAEFVLDIVTSRAGDGEESSFADVSGDGSVTAFDASAIISASSDLAGAAMAFHRFGAPQFPALENEEGLGVISWGRPASQQRTLELPLHVGSVKGSVTSVQLSVPIDPAALAFAGVESGLPDDWTVRAFVRDNVLRVAMAGVTPLVDGTVAKLSFRQVGADRPVRLGGEGFVNEAAAMVLDGVLLGGVGEDAQLLANYPNPFSATTSITYHVGEATHVRLEVYNVLGQHVATLVDEEKEAGTYDVSWDARDNGRRHVASGVYLYRLEAGSRVDQRTMVLTR